MIEDKIMVGLFALCFVLLGVGVYAAIMEGREWDKFSVEHHCRVVGKISGNTFTTVAPTSNGGIAVGVGSTPGKTGYQCDDGMTYWR